jgi:hypothetical protein
MTSDSKIHPRNRTARESPNVIGNPVTTTLESGVGNCFPGLEMDIRNLERRFFPFLAVDLIGRFALVVEVDVVGARQSSQLTPSQLSLYERLARDTANPNEDSWFVRRVEASFGSFGRRELDFDTLDGPDTPPDAWTAIRLIPEGDAITLQLSLGLDQDARTATLAGARQPYLDRTGALNAAYAPGEMTQSLCSPWTHDFRDCGCFYWASNHPDIVQIQRPAGAAPSLGADRLVAWQRSVKGSPASPPEPARPDQRSVELAYYEINNRWQELDVVLDGREQGGSFEPSTFSAVPLSGIDELVIHLRYAAGVEIGVMLEYLSAAYSLRGDRSGELGDDIRAARAEIMRVAIGEMRHLRTVNDVLRELSLRGLTAQPHVPALGVAAALPAVVGATRPVANRPLTRAALEDFIDVERPSFSVDGLYAGILATLRRDAPGALADAIALVIAEGNEHFETLSYIQEWLSGHAEDDYLIVTQQPESGNPLHQTLQQRYAGLLDLLHRAYASGVLAGAPLIAEARAEMLSDTGIDGACRALADAGLQVVFETPSDTRFTAVAPP